MTYSEVLDAIHSRRTFSGGGPTLDRIRRLMVRLGNPQEWFKVIHVAGTNGKGSVCAMIHAGLRAGGYQTGLFTSPYLKDFRERIRINGEMIPQEMLVSCYEAVMEQESVIEQEGYEPINEFELVTAIGFVAFARAKLDYVVLEVGLGGRTDPTNLVTRPAVSCIMPISLDHTAVLGNTIEQIAREKAGIIKTDCPVVIARQSEEAEGIIRKIADAAGAPLYAAPEVTAISSDRSGSKFLCNGMELFVSLLGHHQMENAAAAWQVMRLLGLPEEVCQKALTDVSWPGRLQHFPGKPEFLVDAGHNEAGVKALCEALDSLFEHQSIISIVAMMKDKDYNTCIPAIAERSKLLIGTSVGLPRSLKPREISEFASDYCGTACAESMEEAIKLALSRADPDDLILICGSVYAAGDALVILEK